MLPQRTADFLSGQVFLEYDFLSISTFKLEKPKGILFDECRDCTYSGAENNRC